MHLRTSLFIFILYLGLSGCFGREEKTSSGIKPPEDKASAAKISSNMQTKDPKLKAMESFVVILREADGVHREAWWVLSEQRRPFGKSPFGKVERALLTAMNQKLANKSLFNCDRYTIKQDVLSEQGYPQTIEVFEKCSQKEAAKKIAFLNSPKSGEIILTFYPGNMEEVLGLGPSVVNKAIECRLLSNEANHLAEMNCAHWAQDRTKEQMVRLDVYDYKRAGKNLIKLRGKVLENLTDTRKIEVDIPLEGKIQVTETELYAPIEERKPVPTVPVPVSPHQQGQLLAPRGEGGVIPPTPPPIDPDIVRMQEGEQAEPEVLPAPVPMTPEGEILDVPLDPNTGMPIEDGQEMVDPSSDQGEVIYENENEGEYHAR